MGSLWVGQYYVRAGMEQAITAFMTNLHPDLKARTALFSSTTHPEFYSTGIVELTKQGVQKKIGRYEETCEHRESWQMEFTVNERPYSSHRYMAHHVNSRQISR